MYIYIYVYILPDLGIYYYKQHVSITFCVLLQKSPFKSLQILTHWLPTKTIFVKFCAVYIDINFTEQFSNKCILSSDHRLPEKLTAHETKVREVESERLNKWLKMLKNWDKYSGGEKLKRRIYKGIPNAVRGEVWCRVLEVNQIKQEQDGKYGEMRDKAKLLSPDIRQIDLDVNRTYRNHIMFRERYSVKQQALFNVLAAYSMYNMEIGYCQGMSQIAALLLMYMNEEESFWALSRLMSDEKHAMHGFFIPGFPKLQRFQEHHDKILTRLLPKLKKHLDKYEIHTSLYTLKWFFQCFLDRVIFIIFFHIP
ncbi:UNVERIFIED_CONTAM: USP6 N-terminal-like protein [Trichonephila clavipes]